jgi:phosphoglycerate dehydrogenase-like enzyme
MTRVIVLSQHAARYREILEAVGPPESRWPGAEFRFAGSLEEALPFAATAEVVFGAPDLIALLLPHCSSLRWVQSSWAGVTPLLEQERRDYSLTGVKDIFGAPMAEYVLGWLLALERNIPAHFSATRWNPQREGRLRGKTIGIMGTGSIGSYVARACGNLGLHTRGMNSDGREMDGFDRCWPTGSRLEFAAGLDYLVALLPDTPSTDGLVDARLLAELKPGAILVNGGRGNSVVTGDVVTALAGGTLRHAVLDVLPVEPLPEDDPLWQVEGLTITSHTAAPTPAASIIDIFIDNLERFAEGKPLQYLVDFERGY